MCREIMRGLWSLAPDLKSLIPIVISFIALFVVLRDRRPRLTLRPRKGDWAKVSITHTGTEVIFRGIIEIYNTSSRANAIREYEFWCKRGTDWEKMDSERYHEMTNNEAKVNNVTPLTLTPYSGIEANVMAFTKAPVSEMPIRIEVEDLL